jgi:hypothetical protein
MRIAPPVAETRHFHDHPVILREDGYIEFKAFIESFGISKETMARALYAYEQAIVQAELPLLDEPLCERAAGQLWLRLEAFQHIGNNLGLPAGFAGWYSAMTEDLSRSRIVKIKRGIPQ